MMTTANHPSLARAVAAEVTSSAKWYGIAAVAGCIGGALIGLYDYTPLAQVEPAPVVTPAAVQPPPAVRPILQQDQDLVAGDPRPHTVATRNDPRYCIEQVTKDGQLLGTLCHPDPGGVAGSAMGANIRTGVGAAPAGATYR